MLQSLGMFLFWHTWERKQQQQQQQNQQKIKLTIT